MAYLPTSVSEFNRRLMIERAKTLRITLSRIKAFKETGDFGERNPSKIRAQIEELVYNLSLKAKISRPAKSKKTKTSKKPLRYSPAQKRREREYHA